MSFSAFTVSHDDCVVYDLDVNVFSKVSTAIFTAAADLDGMSGSSPVNGVANVRSRGCAIPFRVAVSGPQIVSALSKSVGLTVKFVP